MPITIQILLDDNGLVTVTGPLKDEILMYGILEKARQTVENFNRQEGGNHPPKIIVPSLKLTPKRKREN